MRTATVVAALLLTGMLAAGCTVVQQSVTPSTGPISAAFASPSEASFGSAGSFVTETLASPTADESDDVGPVIQVAGPTLDDYYPNLVGIFGSQDSSRCIWYSNSAPFPVTISGAEIRNQRPGEAFGLVPATPPPVCRDYLSDVSAPVDITGAHYGDDCDGVTLPALTDPTAPRAACVLNVRFTGSDGTDWTADLVLSLTAQCTDPAVAPCDQLAVTPSADQPVTIGWEQPVPFAACRDSNALQLECGGSGDGDTGTPDTAATATETTDGSTGDASSTG